MTETYDYAIVGAGCSGLSLAVELFHCVPAGSRIALIDPRQSYSMDRLWCFWNTQSHRFSSAVRHEWNRWTVRCAGRQVVHQSSQYAYQYLPAHSFYAVALEEIKKYPSADLLLGTSAEKIIETNDAAMVVTDKGPITARYVFDGRNSPGRHVAKGHLLQHYAGQQVRVQAPVFDPSTMTLMDFEVPQKGGVSFIYALPFSRTEALIEPTVFSKQPLEFDAYTQMIREYLHFRHGVDDYEVLFQERGIIPMTAQLTPRNDAKRIIPIGTSAGMVKGSTGYGFIAIQEMSRRIASGIRNNRIRPLPKPRSGLATILDRIFISYISRHPETAPSVFFDLFNRVTPHYLIPFLSDKASLMDFAKVILAMPTLPFVREAVHALTHREVTA